VETDFAKSYREHLKDKYEWPTFPIIIRQVNNVVIKIGGYSQLKEYMKNPGALT
jgi:glutaredoxin-related protein